MDIIIALPCHVISVNNNPLCGYFLMVIDGTKMKVKMKIYQGLKAAPDFGIVLVRIIPLGNGFQIEMPKSYGMLQKKSKITDHCIIKRLPNLLNHEGKAVMMQN